jgi:fructokinase
VIVVCGEALVDLIPVRHDQTELFAPRVGGSPYNVAIGLARQESPTGFLGRLSRDFFGQLLRYRLLANGVDGRYLREGSELTTVAFVHLEEAKEPEYLFYLENSVDRNLRPEDLPEAFPAEVVALHFGSFSLVLEPIASTLETCMRREHGQRLISLDPNIRSLLIPDRQAYQRRLDGWLEHTDLVKVSRADLSWLYPGEPLEQVAQRWLARGPRLVVVTRGEDGCIGFTSSDSVEIPNRPVKVVDTVGAGDAFMSGLLARVDQRGLLNAASLAALSVGDLEDVLAHASLTAMVTCTRAGADPPARAELEQFGADQRSLRG